MKPNITTMLYVPTTWRCNVKNNDVTAPRLQTNKETDRQTDRGRDSKADHSEFQHDVKICLK